MLKFFAEKMSEYCILNPLKQSTKMTPNELVKLTMLLITGPWSKLFAQFCLSTLIRSTGLGGSVGSVSDY